MPLPCRIFILSVEKYNHFLTNVLIKKIILKHNPLGTSTCIEVQCQNSWLRQAALMNTLYFLDHNRIISNNGIISLGTFIWKIFVVIKTSYAPVIFKSTFFLQPIY